MPVNGDHNVATGYSRRRFLGALSLGLAAVAGAGILLRNLLPTGGKEETEPGSEFPGEDSIFHPRKDPRQEALERRNRT